jgi:hypothetical protein
MGIMMGKYGNKSIIWTQWDYIMVETAIPPSKRFPKKEIFAQNYHFDHPHNGISA